PLHPLPLLAQTEVTVGDQVVICLPDASAACPEGATCVVAPEAPCDGDAGAADADEAEKPAREKPAEAAPKEPATEPAETMTEEPAAKPAEEATEEPAGKPAEAAPEKPATEPAETMEVDPTGEPADAVTEEPAAEPAEEATEEPAGEPAETMTEEPAARPADDAPDEPAGAPVEVAPEEPAAEPAEGVTEEPADAVTDEPAAEAVPLLEPAEGVRAPEEAAVTSLTEILSESPEEEAEPAAPAAAQVEVTEEPAATATVTEVTPEDSRSSAEDFRTTTAADPAAPEAQRKKDGLSDLEKFGLVVLGALVVGAVLDNGDKVVSNTGDRVVVQRDDGRYVVLKDDDTLIRRPGSTVRTETFSDGSTRSIVEREDGSRIVTIRDASGRVLRRARVDADGYETLLIDDLVPVERIDVSLLPKPRQGGLVIRAQEEDAALRAAVLAAEAREAGRVFSLRQIREFAEVRALAPMIDVADITFDTGSAAIKVSEAEKLARLGKLMTELIDQNPAELFLIEGHTDAVGSASSNLALSDRRAESLALALTEYFAVPPENLVVQGYGETELLIDTQGNEPRNRRAVVRMISPLLTNLASR
ncbi:MAG TPA: OmpA family protein, partial [Paracoccaceae bacterium]